MKKYFILWAISLCYGLASSQTQYAISASRNMYRAEDQLVKQQVEYKDPGIKGRGLIWDFSMVQPINEEYQLKYFIPDSSKMNRLCGQEHNTRYYYQQQNDSLWSTGFENATTYMQYTVPELKLRFPFVYGDTLYSRFEGAGQYCHRIGLHVKGYTRVMADAEGDIVLSKNEKVKKALRVHTLRHYTETGKDSVEMTLDGYAWYARGIRYPVFESIKTTLSKKGDRKDESGESLSDTTVFTTSFYYPPELQVSQVETDSIPTDLLSDGNDITKVFTEGRFMPNPVVDNLLVEYKLIRTAKVWFSLHTNLGVPLMQTTPANQTEGFYTQTINMSSLMTGTYSLYVHVDDMVMRQIIIKK